MKVDLSILSSLTDLGARKRRWLMEEPNSSAPKFSEAGVKRIALAAVFPGAAESYELGEDLSEKKLSLTVGPKKCCAPI